ncbi:MAG: glutathione S-transferase family protein [Bradymonadia bacterium]
MGMLIDGQWHRESEIPRTDGAFKRQNSQFRNWITTDGAPGPSGEGGFPAEKGRYHLYVSHACPWAHRTLIFRALKGLEDHISISVVHPDMFDEGWTFEPGEGVIPDPIHGATRLYELYQRADPSYTARVTVPLLWDKVRDLAVSNESSEIIRMLNSAFDDVGATGPDFYPEPLRAEIDAINDRIYHTVNNGVYKTGFASKQAIYEAEVTALFDTLDFLEDHLEGRTFLVGETLTEADWRLFTTLIRFDAVYVTHFKCNKKRIADYPRLQAYLERLYATPGVAGTVHMDHIKGHYFRSHRSLNPKGIVPLGPDLPFMRPL